MRRCQKYVTPVILRFIMAVGNKIQYPSVNRSIIVVTISSTIHHHRHLLVTPASSAIAQILYRRTCLNLKLSLFTDISSVDQIRQKIHQSMIAVICTRQVAALPPIGCGLRCAQELI